MHTPTVGQILQSGLSQPFEALTLRRPMRLFPTSLGLEPLKAGLPSDDFLANFLTGRRTYLAYIRNGFGRDFKNFQNYALQRVETTPAVRQRLLNAVGGSEVVLALLASRMKEGVLIAELAQYTRVAEGALFQVMRTLSSASLKCVHCQAELISKPALWWSEQGCELGEAEYRFVDRILYSVLATTLLPLVFSSDWEQKQHAAARIANLCSGDAHVFRNWLDLVRHRYRAKDLASLATRAGMFGPSPDSHLQRCARGEMLTVDTINEVTTRLNDPKPLRNLGLHARALAFAIDFLIASDRRSSPLEWLVAQAVIKDRLMQLFQDLKLGTTTGARRLTTSVETLA